MDCKIVFSDLDGTLFSSDGKVSEKNEKAIATMREKGIMFVPTTGRAFSEIPKQVLDNPDIRYIISSNGSAIYDKKYNKFFFDTISKDDVELLLSFIKDSTVMIGVHYNGISYYPRAEMDNYEYYRMNDYYYSELSRCVEFVDGDMRSFISGLSEVCSFCIFFKYDDELERCAELVKSTGKFNLTSSAKYQFEISHIGATKGSAVRMLCSKCGILPDNAISMGDSKNDIELLKSTGLSLAVKNAMKELVPYADKVICSNNEHAADYVLSNFVLK